MAPRASIYRLPFIHESKTDGANKIFNATDLASSPPAQNKKKSVRIAKAGAYLFFTPLLTTLELLRNKCSR